jgi:hypothetical protein
MEKQKSRKEICMWPYGNALNECILLTSLLQIAILLKEVILKTTHLEGTNASN